MAEAQGGQHVHVSHRLHASAVHCAAAAGRRKVLWFNMREEPVIYINGNPYVVREANKPFANLEYTGQDAWLAVLRRSLLGDYCCYAHLAELQ